MDIYDRDYKWHLHSNHVWNNNLQSVSTFLIHKLLLIINLLVNSYWIKLENYVYFQIKIQTLSIFKFWFLLGNTRKLSTLFWHGQSLKVQLKKKVWIFWGTI